MGLFSSLMGHSSEIGAADQVFLSKLLVDGEEVVSGFKLYRDMTIFTNKRLIIVDKQGFTAKKVSFQSIPNSNITRFSVETASRFDMDSDVKIWIKGSDTPLIIKVTKNVDILVFQKLLADAVLNKSKAAVLG